MKVTINPTELAYETLKHMIGFCMELLEEFEASDILDQQDKWVIRGIERKD